MRRTRDSNPRVPVNELGKKDRCIFFDEVVEMCDEVHFCVKLHDFNSSCDSAFFLFEFLVKEIHAFKLFRGTKFDHVVFWEQLANNLGYDLRHLEEIISLRNSSTLPGFKGED